MLTKTQNYLTETVVWRCSSDAEYPLEALFDSDRLALRLNDFPDEHLYTLLLNGEEIASFDEWPAQWVRPEKP
jgi:hypothetical protein